MALCGGQQWLSFSTNNPLKYKNCLMAPWRRHCILSKSSVFSRLAIHTIIFPHCPRFTDPQLEDLLPDLASSSMAIYPFGPEGFRV